MAFERFFDDPRYEVCALILGTQMSKTDGILDVMGWRLDTAPRPMLYVGPSRNFVEEQFEPRLMALLDQAPRLKRLVARGKRNKKTSKIVNGVAVRLAWSGSETSLSSDQAGDVMIDEFDKMRTRMRGVGDVFGLAKARSDSYADRKIAVTSTPKRGTVGTIKCSRSGLEFWDMAASDDLESPIWKLWQSGTRHHWAWCCPHCEEWFIPRLRDLQAAPGASPAEARRTAWLCCPVNGCVVDEASKDEMNRTGTYVAPGQVIHADGSTEGDPPDSTTLSLWASGLASPFVSWGERLEEKMKAEVDGDEEKQQGAVNKTGELYAPPRGDAPEWTTLAALRMPYKARELPNGVAFLTCGVDVQTNRLVYVIRGWGVRQESWLIDHGELIGEPSTESVWGDLARLLETSIGRLHISRTFIDSGFRPGKKDVVPVHMVYEFCRRYQGRVWATKGYDHRDQPLSPKRIDVDARGGRSQYGLDLIRLDTDFFKSWVHRRLAWPDGEPGAFHIHEETTDAYLKQLVSESRVVKPSGAVEWVMRSKDNHYLDAEALAYAAAFMLGIQRMSDASLNSHAAKAQRPKEAPGARPRLSDVGRPTRRVIKSNYMS